MQKLVIKRTDSESLHVTAANVKTLNINDKNQEIRRTWYTPSNKMWLEEKHAHVSSIQWLWFS